MFVISIRLRASGLTHNVSVVPTFITEGHAKFQLELAKIIMKINVYIFKTPGILSTDRPSPWTRGQGPLGQMER